jgi:hypothetical protein
MIRTKDLFEMTRFDSLEEQILFKDFNNEYHNALEIQLPSRDEDEEYDYWREIQEQDFMEQQTEYWENRY